MNTSIQPPGLMKMSLSPSNITMIIRRCPKKVKTILDEMCDPTMLACHMNSCTLP